MLRGLVRGAAVAGIAAVAAKLIAGRHTPDDDRQRHVCISKGICRMCGRLDECILPQALSARRESKS